MPNATHLTWKPWRDPMADHLAAQIAHVDAPPEELEVRVYETGEWLIVSHRPHWRDAGARYAGTAASAAIAMRMMPTTIECVLALEQACRAMDSTHRMPTDLATLYRVILDRHPEAEHHLPGESVLPCFMPRAAVDPRWHFIVDLAPDLVAFARDELQSANRRCGLGVSTYAGDDAVLVVAPAQ